MDAILANRYSVWARKPRRPPCGTSGWATNATSSSPPPGGLSFISSIVCFLDPQAFQFRSQCTSRDPEGFCGLLLGIFALPGVAWLSILKDLPQELHLNITMGYQIVIV